MRCRWVIGCGALIIKYRMAGKYYFLRYEKGQSLEGGDYKTFNTLIEAKAYDPSTTMQEARI